MLILYYYSIYSRYFPNGEFPNSRRLQCASIMISKHNLRFMYYNYQFCKSSILIIIYWGFKVFVPPQPQLDLLKSVELCLPLSFHDAVTKHGPMKMLNMDTKEWNISLWAYRTEKRVSYEILANQRPWTCKTCLKMAQKCSKAAKYGL
jgi:hypothetical protein